MRAVHERDSLWTLAKTGWLRGAGSKLDAGLTSAAAQVGCRGCCWPWAHPIMLSYMLLSNLTWGMMICELRQMVVLGCVAGGSGDAHATSCKCVPGCQPCLHACDPLFIYCSTLCTIGPGKAAWSWDGCLAMHLALAWLVMLASPSLDMSVQH